MNQPVEKKLIYILDDDEDVLLLLQKIIENLGIDVETFITPEIFIKRLKDKIPDLCLVDLNLGNNTGAGFQLIQAIRKKIAEDLILIVISKRDSPEDISHALEIGADDYMIKPIRTLVVENKLRQHLKYSADRAIPMIPVAEELKPCSIKLGFYLYSVSEHGFIILSPHFIPKQTSIEFDSGILREIMLQKFSLRVNHNWIHAESGLYASSFKFPTEETNYRSSFRKWILQKKQE